MTKTLSTILGKRRTVGRPRRLSLERIIDAACRLDPADLDMANVASQLNVGVATLYGYLSSREQLLQLVAQRKNQLPPIIDRGQTWQEIVREHAEFSFQAGMDWPELVTRVMSGGVFGAAEADYLDNLLTLLCMRGFTPAQGLELYYATNQIVLGAVVTSTYVRTAQKNVGGHFALMRGALQLQESGKFPCLRQAIESNPLPEVLTDYASGLERLISEFEVHLLQSNSIPEN